jgi:hypothetical protein
MSTVIITVHGNYYLGGCLYGLDCLICIIPLLVFPVCTIYNILLLYIVHLLIWVINCNDGICFMCFIHCLAIEFHIP